MVPPWDPRSTLCFFLPIARTAAQMSFQYSMDSSIEFMKSQTANDSWTNRTKDDFIGNRKTDVARKVLISLAAGAIAGIVAAAMYTCITYCRKQVRSEDAETERPVGNNVQRIDRFESVGSNQRPSVWNVTQSMGARNEAFSPVTDELPSCEVGDSFQLDAPPNYDAVVSHLYPETKEVLKVQKKADSNARNDYVPEDESPPPYTAVIRDKLPS